MLLQHISNEAALKIMYFEALYCCPFMYVKVKVKWSRYSPSVAQRVGRDIALLFHDRGTRRGWVVSSTPRPHFTPGKTQYPFYRRLGGPQGQSWHAENLVPTGIRSRDCPACSQLLYRLSYPAYRSCMYVMKMQVKISSETTRTFALVLDSIVNCIILSALQYICYMQQ